MSSLKYVVIVLVLLIALVGTVFLTLRITILSGKATSVGSPSSIALENSYLFASPLQAKADSQEQIRITVFLLDGRGMGVGNKNVTLSATSLTVSPTQPTTDDTGKAVFDVSSLTKGTFTVSAVVDGKTLPQKVKVTFY